MQDKQKPKPPTVASIKAEAARRREAEAAAAQNHQLSNDSLDSNGIHQPLAYTPNDSNLEKSMGKFGTE